VLLLLLMMMMMIMMIMMMMGPRASVLWCWCACTDLQRTFEKAVAERDKALAEEKKMMGALQVCIANDGDCRARIMTSG